MYEYGPVQTHGTTAGLPRVISEKEHVDRKGECEMLTRGPRGTQSDQALHLVKRAQLYFRTNRLGYDNYVGLSKLEPQQELGDRGR